MKRSQMTMLTLGLVLSGCAANSAPSIAGRWNAVAPASELLELGSDGSMRSTAGGQAYAGVYKFTGRTLTYTLNMPQGQRTNTMSVVSLTDHELVLESRLTGRRTIYHREIAGQLAPRTTNISQFPRAILGRWKNIGDDETLTFSGDGRLSINLRGRQYAAVYEISGDTLEYSLADNPHKTVLTILSLDDSGLRLLGRTRRSEYQRIG